LLRVIVEFNLGVKLEHVVGSLVKVNLINTGNRLEVAAGITGQGVVCCQISVVVVVTGSNRGYHKLKNLLKELKINLRVVDF